MKKTFSILSLLSFGFYSSSLAQSPSTNQNYVMETTVKVPGKTTTASLAGLPVSQANRTIQYFDGLGRPSQTVTWQGSSDGKKDVVQLFEYDAMDREAKKYLLYAEQFSNDGSYKTNGFTNQQNYYGPSGWDNNVVKTGYPFSVTVFEPSPLDRIQRQGFAGATWQPGAVGTERTGRTSYGANNSDTNYGTTGFAVRLFKVTGGNLVSNGFYAANQLYLTISKDENWQSGDGKLGTLEEYKDKDDRVVLKRQFNEKNGNTEVLSTFYVYDDFGNLSFVLPAGSNPDAGVPGATVMEQFCFQYKYDGLKRQVERKVPSKGWEYMVYNELDQVIFTQDAVQRGKSSPEWSFIKYDAHGRVIMTGVTVYSSTRTAYQTLVNAHTGPLWETRNNADPSLTGYTNVSPPNINASECHIISYYDDYDFLGYHSAFDFVAFGSYASKSGRVKSLKTGEKIKNLQTGEMMLSVTYYDDEAHAIQVHSENHLGGLYAANQGVDRVDTEYDFDDSIKSTLRTHNAYGVSTTVLTTFTYDHMGRKKATNHSINGAGPVNLSEDDYNEIGQLRQKRFAGNQHTTIYSYNERGWLKSSNSSPLFNMELRYEVPVSGTVPQYNGNITNQLYTNSISNAFSYGYDRLNRLVKAEAGDNLGEMVSYDLMGNIKSLTRDGWGTNSYDGYDGNKLTQVNGFTTGSFSHDANGNIKADTYRNITNIEYNHLNLPQTVLGSVNLSYAYDATGKKLKKVVSSSSPLTTDYVDGIQYINGSIDFIKTAEGIAKYNGGAYVYEYNVNDHLGNVRVSFDIYGGVVRPLQRDNYYAFGKRKVVAGGNNKYLYNGKELQEELEQYDYGARFYDPVLGRFTSVDPSSDEEDQEADSPYGYVANNPISRNDPDGKIWGNIIGAVVGAAVDYGTQVATNYAKGEKNPWTSNINMVSIGTAAVEGALTSGASAVRNVGAKLAIKGATTLINNTVEVKTSKQGLQVKVEKDVANVLKNSAIDGVVGNSLKVLPGAKTVQKVASKAGVNAGNIAKVTKSGLKAVGVNITRNVNNTVKSGSRALVKNGSATVATVVNSGAKAATNPKVDKLKEDTNRQ